MDLATQRYREWSDWPGDACPTLDDYTAALAVFRNSSSAAQPVVARLEVPKVEPKKLHQGDPCPACGGELQAAIVPTDEQYKRSMDRENPVALQPGADTASPTVRADLGALHRCVRCGYQARFKDEGDEADESDEADEAKGDDGAKPGKQTRRGSR